jgi:hypothetical protein
MGRSGERVVPRRYSTKFLELQNFTLKLLFPKPYNEFGTSFEQGLNG